MTQSPALEFDSARLHFRPLALSDLDLVIEQWTDPEVAKYVDDRTHSEAELRDEMPKFIRRCFGGRIGVWALTEKAGGAKIGTAILLPMPVEAEDTEWELIEGDAPPPREIEVGYILKRAAWGRGFATEACRRMLRFAFEATPLTQIVATIDPRNDPSRRVLLKSGMREEGLIRAYALDLPGFRIRRDEWRADHASRS